VEVSSSCMALMSVVRHTYAQYRLSIVHERSLYASKFPECEA
jgi:hypothetical protein